MKILQIIPADNWLAEFNREDKKDRVRLAFWGLIEEENGDSRVEGFIFGNENFHSAATDDENFLRFVHVSQ